MMTRHEKRLAEVLLDAIGGLEGEQAVERLFGLGLVNLRACEQRPYGHGSTGWQRKAYPAARPCTSRPTNSAAPTKRCAATITTRTNPET